MKTLILKYCFVSLIVSFSLQKSWAQKKVNNVTILKVGGYELIVRDSMDIKKTFKLPVTKKLVRASFNEFGEEIGIYCYDVFKCNFILKNKEELENFYSLTFKGLTLLRDDQSLSIYDVCTFEYSNSQFIEKKILKEYKPNEKGLIFNDKHIRRNILRKGGFITIRVRLKDIKEKSPIYVTFFFEGEKNERTKKKFIKYSSKNKFLRNQVDVKCVDNNEAWKW